MEAYGERAVVLVRKHGWWFLGKRRKSAGGRKSWKLGPEREGIWENSAKNKKEGGVHYISV